MLHTKQQIKVSVVQKMLDRACRHSPGPGVLRELLLPLQEPGDTSRLPATLLSSRASPPLRCSGEGNK